MFIERSCNEFVHPQAMVGFMLLTIILVVWTLFWKAAALWHAARKEHGAWFVILLLFNTLGILDMIYLFGIEKVKADKLFK